MKTIKYSLKARKHSKKSMARQPSIFALDWPMLTVTILLLTIGVIMVFEASVVDAYQQFGDQLHFARLQFQWALVGLGGMLVATAVPFRWIKAAVLPAFVVSLCMLLLVVIPGVGTTVGGATRWLSLGNFTIQPSEVAKLMMILYFSALFERQVKLGPFIGSLVVIAGLIMLQPDLGTTLIISTVALGLFYLAGGSLLHVGSIVVALVGSALLLIVSSPYRAARLFTFLDPQADPLGASYHIRQVIIALGSGGLLGTGIGRSLQKYRYIPESTTDSIFAVIGEETGFVGGTIIVLMFLIFAYRGFRIAQSVDDGFAKLAASGITLMIVLQAYLNLAAMTALVPLTGITLPFISYGGSSLTISLIGVGIILNISRLRVRNVKKY